MKLCLVSGDILANKHLETPFTGKRCCLDMQTDARRERYIESAFRASRRRRKRRGNKKKEEEKRKGMGEEEKRRPPESMLEKTLLAKVSPYHSVLRDSVCPAFSF